METIRRSAFPFITAIIQAKISPEESRTVMTSSMPLTIECWNDNSNREYEPFRKYKSNNNTQSSEEDHVYNPKTVFPEINTKYYVSEERRREETYQCV